MSNTICYHTRLYGNTSVKVSGGMIHGELSAETAESLVSRFFSVQVMPSGNPVFVDREGRRVYLYISVHPDMTKAGREALAAWRKEQGLQARIAAETEAARSEEVEALMAGLSHDEIVRRLSQGG